MQVTVPPKVYAPIRVAQEEARRLVSRGNRHSFRPASMPSSRRSSRPSFFSPHRNAAKLLQETLVKIPRKYCGTAPVFGLVMATVSARIAAHNEYREAKDDYNAGTELGFAAHCLEQYGEYLITHKVPQVEASGCSPTTPLEIFNEALKCYERSIEIFRVKPEWEMKLAFALSARSRTLRFMQQNISECDTPDIIGKMIAYTSEAARLFEDWGLWEDAKFEHARLAKLFAKKAKEDFSFDAQVGASFLKQAECARKGRLGSSLEKVALQKAIKTYCRAALVSSGAKAEEYWGIVKSARERWEELV
jgi:hypothetical protein